MGGEHKPGWGTTQALAGGGAQAQAWGRGTTGPGHCRAEHVLWEFGAGPGFFRSTAGRPKIVSIVVFPASLAAY